MAEEATPTTIVYVVNRDEGLIPYIVSLHSDITVSPGGGSVSHPAASLAIRRRLVDRNAPAPIN